MKKRIVAFVMSFVFILTSMMAATPANTTAAASKPIVVTATSFVDLDTVIEENFLGIGVQWDPSDLFDYTDKEWAQITSRLDFAQFPFIRTIFRANYYCSGWDSKGNPIFTWNDPKNKYMQRIYKILDYCERHNTKVIIGEWDKPSALGITQTDDPRWANLLASLVKHLIVDKKYKCVQYVNLVNEPNGDWAISDSGDKFQIWKRAVTNLDADLKALGIRDKINIIGPDTTDADAWVNSAVDQMAGMIDTYDIHRYAQDAAVLSGSLETTVSDLKKYIVENDPNGAGKQFYMGETGMITGRNGNDQQNRVKDFEYGVFMSDYYTQVLRGGAAGTIAWDLDDSMHTAPSNYQTASKTGAHKTWGFWNTEGGTTEGSTAADKNIRPWFYPVSLLSKYFPAGSQIVYSTPTGTDGLRMVVAKKLDKATGKYNLSFAIVSNQYKDGNYSETSQPRKIKIVVPGAVNKVTLNQYNYFADDRAVDAKGLPVVKKTVSGNLSTGIVVDMPSNGVVVLSTIGAGAKGADAVTVLQPSGSIDLALNKLTAVSSSGYPTIYKKTNINDGKDDTKWVADPGAEQSLTIDLAKNSSGSKTDKSAYTVNRVKINWGTGFALAYKIQVAGTGGIYRDVFSQFKGGKGGLEDIVFDTQTDVRYVRILLNAKGNSLNYAVNEVRIYNTVGAPVTEVPAPPSAEVIDNIDTVPPTTAMYSSAGLILDTGAADTKFDGDAGRTKRPGGDPGYCIYKVDKLDNFTARLYFDKGEIGATYKFEVSADGSTWTDITKKLVVTDKHDSQDTGWYSENLSADAGVLGASGKYLKITFSGGQGWSPQLSAIDINAVSKISDTFADWSNVGLKTSGWTIDTADSANFGGDADRAVRTNTNTNYLVYSLKNAYSFSADVFTKNSDKTGVVKFYASNTGTGSSFTEVTGLTKKTASGGGDNSWTCTAYSKSDLPEGTNYIKVEVSGGKSASGSVQIGAVELSKQRPAVPPVTILDDCSSTTAYALSADGEIAIDSGNLANFNDDSGRFKRSWSDTQSVVYDAGSLLSFKIKVYSQNGFDGTGAAPDNGKVEFFGSADNKTWVKITTKNSDLVATAENWSYSYFEPSGAIPAGMRYLKITLSGGGSDGTNCWSPEIADVKINVN